MEKWKIGMEDEKGSLSCPIASLVHQYRIHGRTGGLFVDRFSEPTKGWLMASIAAGRELAILL